MPSTPSSDPLIGALLDSRYDIVSRIARGGMATVYLATDRRLDRYVAVKVMHPHMVDDGAFVSRFIREARSAARINDPHVVAVFDQGREGDVLYLVMEYVPGMTLRDVLNREGALTPGQALDVLLPVLDALAAAYQAGIVHRDVKPENVLLSETRRGNMVKVTDFGLARAVATSDHTGSSTGTVIGTPAYLSPELISRGVADARSDVYSAGIMLYEMVLGNPPYEGDVAVQVAFRHVNEDVPPPTDLDPGLPDPLDDLVLAATARDPDERPTDAAAYAAMVRRVRERLTDAELDREPEGYAARGPGVDATRAVRAPAEPAVGGRAARRFPTDRPMPTGATQRLNPGPDFRAPQTATSQLPRTARRQGHIDRPAASPAAVSRRRRPRSPGVLAALLVLAALIGVGAWYFLAGPGDYTTVPVVNGSRTTVEAGLTGQGFKPRHRTAYSESVPAGSVIGTEPAAGKRVPKHSDVTVVVSAGTAWTSMPSVVGQTRETAATTLDKLDIRVAPDPVEKYDDRVAAGAVVSSSPAPRARVKRGSQVRVVLSKGPAPVSVPDVSGKPENEATASMQSAGLLVRVKRSYDDTVPKGRVLSQEPAGAGQAHRGDTVTVTVSQGPPLVTVPSVVGKNLKDARSTLQDAGFKVKVKNVMGGFFGTVRSQQPSAATQVPKGSTITLTVV